MRVDEKSDGDIDESLYSRQIYVLGVDAMRKMQNCDILISGLGGLGVEIAKNVILGGVKSVTLHDQEVCSVKDLSSQFYLNKSLIGKNRAECSHKQLADLNNYVTTIFYTGELSETFISSFTVIVLTEKIHREQKRISEICHAKGIALIIADTKGLFGQVFCDFGENFIVYDDDGLPPKTSQILTISRELEGVVTTEKWHNLFDGEFVTFSGIEGMTELNGAQPMRIKKLGNYTFSVGDTSNFGEYESSGFVTQIKMPKMLTFKSLSRAENEAEFTHFMTDINKMNNAEQIQMAFSAYHRFVERHQREPFPWHESDALDFMKICLERAAELSLEVDVDIVTKFSKICRGNVAPMNSVIGGIAAQEVMKACSGKFMPISQYFCFDALECLRDEETMPKIVSQQCGYRYDSQAIVFGDDIQRKIENLKFFIVGAGAIGCELLKNFAMMGVGCGNGRLIVTDMDHIEKSNLNRQFLFRPSDVSMPKSRTAARAVKMMNNELNIVHHEDKVCAETEKIYTEYFFDEIDGVANALDNVDARLFVDRKCVIYRKPLIDSGTLGAMGNVQVVIPHLTESYASSIDPPEKSIPVCTLRHFPNEITHTIQWARDKFEGLFTNDVMDAHKFLTADEFYLEQLLAKKSTSTLETLQSIKSTLIDNRPNDFFECIRWARIKFEELFTNQIKQLLFNFPPDQTTPSGQLFWSGSKKMPTIIAFDVNQKLHIDFIVSAANLYAEMYGLEQNRDYVSALEYMQRVDVPIFEPKTNVKIPVNDSEIEPEKKDDDDDEDVNEEEIQKLADDLQKVVKSNIAILPHHFEKDNDANLHMDFVVAASNLRAANYKIPPADKLKSKLIAGKIQPAIATSTSIVAGLASLEVYKIAQGFKELKRYRSSYFNLADNTFAFSEPRPAETNTFYSTVWTMWDSFEIDRPMTLRQLLDYFKKEYRLEITMLSHNVTMLFSFFMSEKKLQERENLLIDKCIEHIMEEKIEPHIKSLVLEAYCCDENDMDVEVPYIRYLLKS